MSELLFNGITAYARVEDQQWSAPLLAIRPHKNQFTFVVVPPERLAAVAVVPHHRHTHWSVELVGEFSRTNDNLRKVVGPMADADARSMVAAIAERYELPRVPIEASPHDIATLPAHSYVVVNGRYFEGHCEAPNFEGVMLERATCQQNGMYRVTGFTSPGIPFDADARPVGFSGPRITAVAIEPL